MTAPAPERDDVVLAPDGGQDGSSADGLSVETDAASGGSSGFFGRLLTGSLESKPSTVATTRIAGMSLMILSALLLAFVAEMTFVGALAHHRDQSTAYAQFRKSAAEATAPAGQVDINGALLVPGTPVAILDIPAIGVNEVVLEGTTSGMLMRGPGHRRDTVLPGQAGTALVFGRQSSFGGPFGKISTLKNGDLITATTGQGTSTYKVLGVRREGQPVPPALAADAGRITLITADGPSFAPSGVLRVDADLVGKAQPTPNRVLGVAALAPSEFPMEGESTAWIVLVLWAQALLLVALASVWALARWGRWQTWIVVVPLVSVLALAVAQQAARLLPNLL